MPDVNPSCNKAWLKWKPTGGSSCRRLKNHFIPAHDAENGQIDACLMESAAGTTFLRLLLLRCRLAGWSETSARCSPDS